MRVRTTEKVNLMLSKCAREMGYKRVCYIVAEDNGISLLPMGTHFRTKIEASQRARRSGSNGVYYPLFQRKSATGIETYPSASQVFALHYGGAVPQFDSGSVQPTASTNSSTGAILSLQSGTSHASESPMITLIVDSYPDSATSVALLFETAGIKAIPVTTTHDALLAIQQYAPQTAFVDLEGSAVDGAAIISAVRNSPVPRVRSATLIAFTGLRSAVYQERASLAGFDYYLEKPLDPHELVQLCLGIAHLPGPAKFRPLKIDHSKLRALSEHSNHAIQLAQQIGKSIRAMRK